MLENGDSNPDLIVELETVQRRGLSAMVHAPSTAVAEELGIRFKEDGSRIYLASGRIPGLAFNRIQGFGVDGPVSPRQLDEAVEWLRIAHPGSILMLPPVNTAPGLLSGLEERGLERFVLDASVLHLPHGHELRLPPNGRVRVEVASPQDAAIFGEVICEGLGKEPELARWPEALVGQPNVTAYIAWDGGTAIGGAALFVDGRTAWLFLAATRPGYRGRGAQTALLARRVADARRAGMQRFSVEVLAPHPGHEDVFASYRNCRHLGFEIAYRRPNYVLRDANRR